MIISTIATALVQCSARTQAAWITLVAVAEACSSLTVRVDMVFPAIIRTGLYAGNRVFVTAMSLSDRYMASIAVTKKRAGSPRLAVLRVPCWGNAGTRGSYDAGISTVSTTWITPFD